MKSIQILDCTLRDGGYCNQWNFGFDNIKLIVRNLTNAGIDVIECGFISNKEKFGPNISKFSSVEDISEILPIDKKQTQYVAMINYGEYDVEQIPNRSSNTIDGIRIAFHKKNIEPALKQCETIKKKGYKVFVQAMVSMAYSDIEFLDLIKKTNELDPYAFYIVDSFGMMKRKDLYRYYSLIENNLNKNIIVGFHSHNNLQLAYSNALYLLDVRSGRDIIFDSSIYGMGRGAGNLNTELFIDHLNEDYNTEYNLKPILSAMDEVINDFYQTSPWGYSLPNYLSAIHNAHPNYAGYFADKNTLTVESMDKIFDSIDFDKKVEFDKNYAEKLYLKCMSLSRSTNKEVLKQIINGKRIVLIAPGKSSFDEREKIIEYCTKNDVISVSINVKYDYYNTDFTFISNIRRYRDYPINEKNKCIITTNIDDADTKFQVDYQELLNDIEIVRDNAGLMAVKLFMTLGAKKIILAGFDGYSYESINNYATGQKIFITKKAMIDATNEGMSFVLKEYSKNTDIEYLTAPINYSV